MQIRPITESIRQSSVKQFAEMGLLEEEKATFCCKKCQATFDHGRYAAFNAHVSLCRGTRNTSNAFASREWGEDVDLRDVTVMGESFRAVMKRNVGDRHKETYGADGQRREERGW